MKKIFYVCNSIKDINFSTSKQILFFLKQKDALIYVEEEKLSLEYGLNLITKDILTKIDLAIVLGGDGTLLKYLRSYGKYQIPTIGINYGRVGALTTINLADYEENINCFFADKYDLTKQFTLVGTIKYEDGREKCFNIYNEAIIYRGSSLKILPINVSINDCKNDTIYADGMIIATPTGSSAYNLSAGGPLLTQNCGCYVVTPICPQIKSFASLIVSKNDSITLSLPDESDNAIVSVDGCEKYSIGVNDKLCISLSKININLVRFSNNESVYQTIYKIIDSIKR